MDYLSGVQFTNATPEELNARLIVEKINSFYIQTQVFAAIQTISNPKAICNKKEWKACTSNCFTTLHGLVDQEIHSTAYILRALSKMVLSIDPVTIKFTITSKNSLEILTLTRPSDILTGIWEHDSQYIQMEPFDLILISPRLIMGFGPSASGKTYWAKTLITILSEDPTFPKTFLSIDGGILRDASLVYQTILDVIKSQCLSGLDNLVLSSFSLLRGSIFDSEVIKSIILKFLERNRMSLYVPETLGGCGSMRPSSCDGKIKKYVSLTGDTNWIGVCIWQHLHGSECIYEGQQTCVGCSESGKAREIKEGKKYSDISYDHSYTQGLKELAKAPGGQFNIHNCGRPNGQSTIQFNIDDRMLQPLLNADNQAKYKYVLDFVEKQSAGKRRRTRRKRRSRRASKKEL